MTMLSLLKISLMIFIAGNLLEMGLKINLEDALKGLRNIRFVGYTLLWGFVLGPGLAYAITLIIPLQPPHALGLILLGMAPAAPFIPMFVNKAKGDLGFTASFMVLVSIGTVIFMPIAVPLMAKGLSVSHWTIAKPLVLIILLPMAVGMLVLRLNKILAWKLNPIAKKTTVVFAVITVLLSIIVFREGLLEVRGTYAIASLIIFFVVITTFSYWFSFGLRHEQKIILSIGMSTRNLGASVAPLLSIAELDQRTIIMVVMALPLMLISPLLAIKYFGHLASKVESGLKHTAPRDV